VYAAYNMYINTFTAPRDKALPEKCNDFTKMLMDLWQIISED
jgi:hypothetical protein